MLYKLTKLLLFPGEAEGGNTTINIDGGNSAPSGQLIIGGGDDSGDDGGGSDTDTSGGDTDTGGGDDADNPSGDNLPSDEEVISKARREGKQPTTAQLKILNKNKDQKKADDGAVPDTTELDPELSTQAQFDAKAKREKEQADAAAAKLKDGQQNTNTQNQRDYTVFKDDPEMEKLAKSSPNNVFNALKKLAVEKNEVRTQLTEVTSKLADAEKGIVKLPDNYHAHQQGYIFSPEYRQYKQGLNLAKKQNDHWTKQLLAIEAGEPWRDLKGVDDQGNLVYGDTIEAKDTTAQDKLSIQDARVNTANEVQAFDSRVQQLAQGHTQRFTAMKSGINAEIEKTFPWVKDEKFRKETKLEVFNPASKQWEEKTMEKVLEDAMNILPKSLRNDLLAPVVQNLIASCSLLQYKVAMFESKTQVQQQIKKDEAAAEPASSGKGQGAARRATGSNVVPDLSGMDD